ncbi:MAG: GTPase ObgE [Kiritimatiellae bacterium]|nr:GTPase ObgE [Kiritimatiellia bacterium]
MRERLFIDCLSVHAKAGRGGDGSPSFRREAHVEFGGPDGGDGGRGGNVVLRGSRHVDTLLGIFYSPRLFAQNGEAGRGQRMHGRDGDDLVVDVPCGTTVTDETTGEVCFDVVDDGQEVVIARGGRGGLGNVHWKSSTNQAPTQFTPGQDGEEFRYRLELKVIADVGLVGFPNAGKSSLLAAISDARPKIGSYPFTTLNPSIGVVNYDDYSSIRVADVPGIIDGASEGIGLGIDFLRHISRSRVLVFVIDAAGIDGREPKDDYKALRRELAAYDPSLLERPSLLVANKVDEAVAEDNVVRLERAARRKAIRVCTIDGTGLDELKERLKKLLKPVPDGAAASGRRAGQDHSEVSAGKLANASFLSL